MQDNLEWLEPYSEFTVSFCIHHLVFLSVQTLQFERHYGASPYSSIKLTLQESTSDQRDEHKENNADFLRSPSQS